MNLYDGENVEGSLKKRKKSQLNNNIDGSKTFGVPQSQEIEKVEPQESRDNCSPKSDSV